MNYIYDILLNFKDKLYDFYDWNISDDITHIRKIPLFKINSKDLMNIKKNKVKVENDWLDKIRDKTEMFSNKSVVVLDYACILSDGTEVLAILFNNNGESFHKSKLLVDEDNEVIEVCERISEITVNYEILKTEDKDEFKTRKEMEINEYIMEQIGVLNSDDNLDKLKYLYYECFNKKVSDKEKILNDIGLELKNNWDKIAFKLYNFFKLTSINK